MNLNADADRLLRKIHAVIKPNQASQHQHVLPLHH